jgi:hypothetical protein
LVFHDTSICGDSAFDEIKVTCNGKYPKLLKHIIWGHMLHLFMLEGPESEAIFNKHEKNIRFVDEWHGKTALDEMVSHRYVTTGGEIEESVFSSGRAVRVNFTAEDITAEGMTIPGYGYVFLE